MKLQIDNNNLINRYGIKQPETTRKETELRLKTCDPTTKDIIINYLRLDNFELVKNIAWVTNNENAGNIISHMDWWLARNYALIELLEKSKDMKRMYNDKIEWKIKSK